MNILIILWLYPQQGRTAMCTSCRARLESSCGRSTCSCCSPFWFPGNRGTQGRWNGPGHLCFQEAHGSLTKKHFLQKRHACLITISAPACLLKTEAYEAISPHGSMAMSVAGSCCTPVENHGARAFVLSLGLFALLIITVSFNLLDNTASGIPFFFD